MTAIEKILDIQRNLRVEKTGYDERNDYRYYRAEDVATAVRGEMNRVGLIHRTVIEDIDLDNKWDQNGRNRPRVTFKADVQFIDPEDGTVFSTQVMATGSDTGGDKATRKAQVQAFKIAVIDLFIVTEEADKFDSDAYPESEPINVSKAEQKVDDAARLAELTKFVSETVKNESHPVDGSAVNAMGIRLGKEAGLDIPEGPLGHSVWKKNLAVMESLVKAIQNGEME